MSDFKLTFSKISFRNTISMSNSSDPDQARRFVGPNLDTNCLQRLSADEKRFHLADKKSKATSGEKLSSKCTTR